MPSLIAGSWYALDWKFGLKASEETDDDVAGAAIVAEDVIRLAILLKAGLYVGT
jgi:hypothetical protein